MKKTKKTTAENVAAQQRKNDSPVLKEVKQIYAFMKSENLGVIKYEQKGVTVQLVRNAPAQVAVPVAVGAGTGSAAACTVPSPQYSQVIKSPLMGIFFRGASPSAAPFIRDGEKVKAGDLVCLIEAMKVFNEVRADRNCVIKKALVENGKPIKAGEALFAIELL